MPSFRSSGCETPSLNIDERKFYKIEVHRRSDGPTKFARRGDDYGSSVCAFAVKPRAFGAPHAAPGL
jgi:hypothetical protein